MGDVTFRELREANRARLPDFKRAFPDDGQCSLDTWTPLEWGAAMMGEGGELLNLLKKLRRGQGISALSLMCEVADVQIYLDLLCQKLGFELETALVYKFNQRSEDIGSEVRL